MKNATNDNTGRTPGDWTLEYDGSLVMAGQVIGIGVQGLGPDSASPAEKKANARLMSAGPDLLAAAKAVLLTVQLHAERYPGDREAQQDHLNLRAAIAKAEGR